MDPKTKPTLEELQRELLEAIDKGLNDKAESILKEMKDELAKLVTEAEKTRAAFSVPGSAEEKHKGQKFSLSRFFYAVGTGDWSQSPLEKAISDAAKNKANQVSPDSAGGFIVPTEVLVDQVIPLLYAKSVAMELGATRLNGLTAIPVLIPRVSGGTTAYWVSEGGTITASEMAFEQMRLSPKGLATLTPVSTLLSQVGNPAIDGMIAQDQARKMALKLDLALLKGVGGSEITGILNATGVNTATFTATPTYDELLAFVGKLREDNALEGSLGWAVSHPDMLQFEQMKDVTGGTDNKANIQPLQRRTLLNAQGTELLGYPVKVSTQLADGEAIFGNWSELVVGQWFGMEVATTNAVGFTTATNHIRTLTYVDAGIRHAESFCIPA